MGDETLGKIVQQKQNEISGFKLIEMKLKKVEETKLGFY